MDAKETDNDAARRFAGRVIKLEQQRDAAGGVIVDMVKILKVACDRDWKDEAPHQVAVIAANAIHHRDGEIEAHLEYITILKTEIVKLKDRLDDQAKTIRQQRTDLTAEVEATRVMESRFIIEQVKVKKLRDALEQSVKLQSHYAGILNEYDNGRRIKFNTAQEWIDRLEVIADTEEK